MPTALSNAARKEEEEKKKGTEESKEGVGTGRGALSGAMGKGGIISTVIGAGLGAVQGNQAKKAAARTSGRRRHRRVGEVADTLTGIKQKRQAGLLSLSQAVSDFAANLR